MSLSTEVEELLHTPLTFLAEDELQEAFTIVTTLLEVFPEEKNRFKSTLEGILATWGRLLERSGQFDKLFACYHKALIVFCDHEGILSNLGAHLLRAGYMEKASEYFHESLKVNSNYLPAQRNLETVRSYMVERWHFRMLNDNIRNNGFREAIIKKIKKGFDCVLDIGTGTGILSLFAIEAGAQNVYACDSNETMINISRQVFERNNAIDKVKIIHKLSNDIKIPDNIPERCSSEEMSQSSTERREVDDNHFLSKNMWEIIYDKDTHDPILTLRPVWKSSDFALMFGKKMKC